MKYPSLLISLLISAPLLCQNCPPGALAGDRAHKLYLYFPTAIDNTFPSAGFDFPPQVSPLGLFNITNLDPIIVGTTADLRDEIFTIVTEDYCEFDVEVIQTTTSVSPTDPQWQIIGIGSDGPGVSLGRATTEDLNNVNSQDYARVWGDNFDQNFGRPGGALFGAGSTLERWARAIGHTVSHEAGHNYGLAHSFSNPAPGEDQQTNHIMASGTQGLTGEIRASRRRHFSNESYEVLAHNIGLNVKTLYNWDFVNPNAEDAYSLVVNLLSTAADLTLSWFFNGDLSPWTNPTVTATGGTRLFEGTTYNVFELEFSTPKTWIGGSPGIVGPAVEFHTGATFLEPDPVIVSDVRLRRSDATELELHPRMVGFDITDPDLLTGEFPLKIANLDEEAGNLIISDFDIQFLPRMADIESMVNDSRLRDIRGIPIVPHGGCQPDRIFELTDRRTFRLARLSDPRFVDITYDSGACEAGPVINPKDSTFIEEVYCPEGYALSLFPSTMVYIRALVTDPNARVFNPETKEFEDRPLTSAVFYQFSGIVPDYNNNGVDDLIDIREGTSSDDNRNGVPDEVDPGAQADEKVDNTSTTTSPFDLPLWVYLLLGVLLLVVFRQYYKGKK